MRNITKVIVCCEKLSFSVNDRNLFTFVDDCLVVRFFARNIVARSMKYGNNKWSKWELLYVCMWELLVLLHSIVIIVYIAFASLMNEWDDIETKRKSLWMKSERMAYTCLKWNAKQSQTHRKKKNRNEQRDIQVFSFTLSLIFLFLEERLQMCPCIFLWCVCVA